MMSDHSQPTEDHSMLRTLCGALVVLALVAPARADDEVDLGGMKSKAPATWKKAEPGRMQMAAFNLPKAEGDKEDAKLLIFYNGPQGMGGKEDNIRRYRGMFKAPAGDNAKVESGKVGNAETTTVDVQGTYLFKAAPFDPNAKTEEKPDFRMIAVIFDTTKGPYYLRFIGPQKTVEKHKKDFDSWLKNFK
jgi:hypothetical protein